jgi:hypothetical protein
MFNIIFWKVFKKSPRKFMKYFLGGFVLLAVLFVPAFAQAPAGVIRELRPRITTAIIIPMPEVSRGVRVLTLQLATVRP